MLNRRIPVLILAPLLFLFLILAPAAANAQTYGSTGTTGTCSTSLTNLGAFFQNITCIINSFLVPLIFAVAFIVFLFGIYRYFIAGANNEEKRQEGQQLAIYALIGFFLMFSIWGIVNLLLGTFSFGNSSQPCYPQFGSSQTQTNCGGSTQTTTGIPQTTSSI